MELFMGYKYMKKYDALKFWYVIASYSGLANITLYEQANVFPVSQTK